MGAIKVTIRVGLNGFGRMGRLALRACFDWPEIEIVHINEPGGSPECLAHLLNFDSVHGIWNHEAQARNNQIHIDDKVINYSQNLKIQETNWNQYELDLVIDCSGVFRTKESLQPYFDIGIKRVLVSAPVKEDGVLNVVVGVNDHLFNSECHKIVTAASCTTNCLAPVVKVIHEGIGIKHGVITTIHDITNTQSILDQPHKDLRRARASSMSLIPTSTGSAKAIGAIFPELEGKLNGLAVRVPLANASLTDCVFELNRKTDVEEVNGLLEEASKSDLKGILGFEKRPLVSIDFKDDVRSSIVDALSTMVLGGTQTKILSWYDNEIGYVHRMMELALKIA